MKKNLLVIHPNLDGKDVSGYYPKSNVIKTLSQNLENHKKELKIECITSLYDEYPDFKIDVKKEQDKLLNTELTVFLYPFYWYNTPPLLKLWYDAVLQKGFAYSKDGDKLKGKNVLHIISTGGVKNSYLPSMFNHFRISDLLHPQEQTAYLCQSNWIEPYIIHGSLATSEKEIEEHFLNIKETLLSL